jgi:hypothetical protein
MNKRKGRSRSSGSWTRRKGLAREKPLQILLSSEELKAVETFRFQHRMPSRSQRFVICSGADLPLWRRTITQASSLATTAC